jgi:4-hydroxy-3-methylbut-2-enyl diphosphate reductase
MNTEMQVTVAQSAGFCFGVKRAVKLALETAGSSSRVEMLGDIVHNEEVVKQIEQAGIKKIQKLTSGKDKILLIRAHGAPRHIYETAAAMGYHIVDATCPMVKEIHDIVTKKAEKGYTLIVIGDRDHDEVRGITGQSSAPSIVIERPDDIDPKELNAVGQAAVVVQSTQSQENVDAIVARLEKHIETLQVHDTICNATKKRQHEIRTMPLENDVMLVVGSKQSANTKRLYEISRSLNSSTYWIQSKSDIRPEWFSGATKVGITAGASTPDKSIDGVVDYIENM